MTARKKTYSASSLGLDDLGIRADEKIDLTNHELDVLQRYKNKNIPRMKLIVSMVVIIAFFVWGQVTISKAGGELTIPDVLTVVFFVLWGGYYAEYRTLCKRYYPKVYDDIRLTLIDKRAAEQKHKNLFGGARAATIEEIHAAGFDHKAGLFVGIIVNQENPSIAESVFYAADRHAVTIAPNRSGKGRTVLIPHLAHYGGSLVVNDIKGENAFITAQWRRDRLGQDVFILNPYGLFEDEFKTQGFTSARFNPLASFDVAAKDFTLRLDTLAADLVRVHDPKHSFWINSARQIVAGYLRFLVETKEPHARNICDLYGFFKRAQVGGDSFKDELRGMFEKSSERVYEELSCLVDTSGKIGEFLGTALSDWEFMRDDALRDTLSGADFDFRDFKRKPSTLYIIAPPDGIKRRDMWLRLVVASGVSLLGDVTKGRGLDTLFLLDEFPVLGHMETIASRYTLVAGYGVRFWLVTQSLQQLKEHYPDQWQTFLSSAGFQQFFTPNDLETAEYISKMAGNRTAFNPSFDKDGNGGGGYVGVPLFSPQEVRDFPNHAQFLFAPGLGFPILLSRANYDQNPAFSGLNPNPYA